MESQRRWPTEGVCDAEGVGGPGLPVKRHQASAPTSSGNLVKFWGPLEEDDIF
jgi:hypothetical protein